MLISAAYYNELNLLNTRHTKITRSAVCRCVSNSTLKKTS